MNMTLPKMVFECSKKTEAKRILHTALSIISNFYSSKGFLVLPYFVPGNSKTIYFPDLEYNRVPNFWKAVKTEQRKSAELNLPMINPISQLLPDSIIDSAKIENNWSQNLPTIWQNLINILPKLLTVKNIKIIPTLYGSICTAYPTKNKSSIIIYIRKDGTVANIIEAVLTYYLMFSESGIKSVYSWEEKEAIIDFILTETNLANTYKNYSATLKAIRQKQQQRLAKDSSDYLKKLGMIQNQVIEIKNGNIHINNKDVSGAFTVNENKILTVLINNKGKTVSFDTIANIMWGDKSFDNFSPYAITKCLQRIRVKIGKLGIQPEIIQTKKGEGYSLV
jgi:DNA-binding winged helix-turn-helix (wHTH) protein